MPSPEILTAACGIIATLIAYLTARMLMKVEYKKISISKVPVVFTAAFILILIIESAPIDYAQYQMGGDMITYLLGPATIALAYPLFQFWKLARENAPEVCAAVVVSAFTSIFTVLFLAQAFGLDRPTAISFTPKCVTAPVAIEICRMTGGIEGLTLLSVFISGLGGAFLGHKILALFGIKNDLAVGLAMGATSHMIGTAKCVEVSDRQAAMAALVVVLAAVFTTILAALVF